MLCVWVYGCDPGRVSNGSRLALYQTLSVECPSPIFFWHVFCVIVPFFLSFLSCFCFALFSCSRSSFVDVPLIFSCPAGHVQDWQPRILLGMVEARSVTVENTTTTTTTTTTKMVSSSRITLPSYCSMVFVLAPLAGPSHTQHKRRHQQQNNTPQLITNQQL